MNETELKDRTKRFAVQIVSFLDELPRKRSAEILSNQLMRSATSVGANYRAACRGRSRADFISKIGIVEEEADECIYWLELLVETHLAGPDRVQPLLQEAMELTAIFTATGRTAKAKDKSRIANRES